MGHWSKHVPESQDGVMNIDQIEGFLKDNWGMELGDWARKYFRAVDAYNQSYSGIKADDFLDCNMLIDLVVMKKVLDSRNPSDSAKQED